LATLDELLEMEGVVAALEFAPDGQLVDYRAEMDLGAEAAELAGTFCAATTMMFNGLVTALTPVTQMDWMPQQGWAYAGGHWTIAIGRQKAVFIDTNKADFNRLFEALGGFRRR